MPANISPPPPTPSFRPPQTTPRSRSYSWRINTRLRISGNKTPHKSNTHLWPPGGKGKWTKLYTHTQERPLALHLHLRSFILIPVRHHKSRCALLRRRQRPADDFEAGGQRLDSSKLRLIGSRSDEADCRRGEEVSGGAE